MSVDLRVGRGRVWAGLARVVSWPLALAFLLLGLVLRLLAWPVRAALWQARPDRGIPVANRRLTAYVPRAGAYLVGSSDRLPPLTGPVPAVGDSRGPWGEVRRRLTRNRLAMASWIGIVLYLYVSAAASAGILYPGYERGDREAPYVTPTVAFVAHLPFVSLGEHPLGTDLQGRDILGLTVHGTKTALVIGAVAALLACTIGLVLGAVAGFFGRWVDEAVVWLFTTLESIPYLLLMLSFGFVFRKNEPFLDWYQGGFLESTLGISVGLYTIVLAVGLTYWVGVCRLVRGEFIRLRERDYVTAARALGVPTRRIIFRHLTPNAFHLVLISFSLLFMSAIKSEVILSFLGVGLAEGEEVSWGRMISNANLELLRAEPVWWQITAATVAMFGLLLFVNLFTDALRDALDPRLRN